MDLAKIERVYTSYAKIYDRVFGKVFHEGRQSVIRNLNVQPDEKILEVGIGTGLALPDVPPPLPDRRYRFLRRHAGSSEATSRGAADGPRTIAPNGCRR